MTGAIDIGKRAVSATLTLNIALAQQAYHAASAVPYLGAQMMQTLLSYAIHIPMYGMRAWLQYLPQASLPVQQPIVTVGPNTSFYFRGPENRLNMPAVNLAEFTRLAQEIDDATWEYHLRRGDYTHWFQAIWQDEALAAAAAELEHAELSAHASRARMQDLIAQRYALPPEREQPVGELGAQSL